MAQKRMVEHTPPKISLYKFGPELAGKEAVGEASTHMAEGETGKGAVEKARTGGAWAAVQWKDGWKQGEHEQKGRRRTDKEHRARGNPELVEHGQQAMCRREGGWNKWVLVVHGFPVHVLVGGVQCFRFIVWIQGAIGPILS